MKIMYSPKLDAIYLIDDTPAPIMTFDGYVWRVMSGLDIKFAKRYHAFIGYLDV